MEQGFPSETELDELDPESTHFLLSTTIPSPPPTSLVSLLPTSVSSTLSQTENKGGDRESTIKPVGTVRLTPRLGKVSRLAVDKEYRQYGFGKVIMEGLEKFVREAKGEVLEEFKPVTREENGKTIVKLKLHSQVGVDTLAGCRVLMIDASGAFLQEVWLCPRRPRIRRRRG